MHTRLEPPIDQWPTPTAQRPIWTGHQLTLFHPGILAKYLAAQAVSEPTGIPFAHVAVDQDVYDPLKLTVPRVDGQRLYTQTFQLAPVLPGVPVGMQPPVQSAAMSMTLNAMRRDTALDADRLAEAFASAAQAESLAAQMDQVLRCLLPAYAAGSPPVFASTLLADETEIGNQLLHDAPRCAALYNQAVSAYPGAGMKPMGIEPDRVEVPVWALRWMQPRERVYVDIADSTPIFITEDGEPLTDDVTLAPRALLMTALLRRPDRCGLFIHGTGGWQYDRITEQWWQHWRGETLAPMALATADVRLDFGDLPVNTPDDVERAVWRAHHLPHNLDRELALDHTPAREKRELLDRMHDDRDKQRRRAAFELIHQINGELADQHGQVIAEARRAVETTRLGVANARLAQKRDWSFLLYPPSQLETLRQQIAYPLGQLSSEPGKPG
ncbi:hypothetical protein [Algisphaera agarilytica]|uniref:Uncharacterized protein n=1 Tax=Algisphaera agarilytica TaxID=1385975 RepID=A0A7X0H4A9_9BACT|nr:hypothetical protein [Algisphaera agarilytica]MBB6428797.1 hypothetical protein [Algisphaera agarilytica]